MNPSRYDYQMVPAGTYDLRRNFLSPRFLWHHRKFLSVINSIDQMVRDEQKICIVDLGCGSGVFLRDYVKNDWNKVGYDINESQLAYARTKENKIYFSNRMDEIVAHIKSLPTGTKVIFVLIELLEHLSYDEILEINNLFLKIDKMLQGVICTTPNRESFWPTLEKWIDRFFGTDYHLQHTNLMNEGELKKTCHVLIQGLSNEFDASVCTILGFPHWLLGIEWRRTLRSKFKGMVLISSQNRNVYPSDGCSASTQIKR